MDAPRTMKPAIVIGPLGAWVANQPIATPPTTLPSPSEAISQP